MEKRERARRVLDILSKEFPALPPGKTSLDFSTPLELLIATMLSAQCTDERVNKTTPALFKRFRKAGDYASAEPPELEGLIKSVNFYRNKAKSIIACGRKMVDEFGGEVPDTLEGLTSLPGVGRKTANIVLGSAFGRDALAVDTHVKRVSRRLGLAESEDPDKIEAELTAVIPQKRWTTATLLLILHGRKTCKAKKPLCDECPIKGLCEYYGEGKGGGIALKTTP